MSLNNVLQKIAYALMGANPSISWEVPAADKTFFIAHRVWRIINIRYVIDTQGSDGSAVTGVIRKVPSGTAVASGTAVHSGSIDLKGTANTVSSLTLSTSAAALFLAPGDRLAFDLGGTGAAAVGCATVTLIPA